jgi:hypothetical protein
MSRKKYDYEQDAWKVSVTLKTIEKLQEFVRTHKPEKECCSEDELVAVNYQKYFIGNSAWYMHPELTPILGPYNLSRYAMLLNMRKLDGKITHETISSFIFTKDKEQLRKARGLDDNDYDRFDTFRCTPDGNGNFRKNGSMNGPKDLSQKRRDMNKMFLRALMYGTIKEDNIRCAWTGENVENLETPDDDNNVVKYIDIFHLHHAYYIDGTSIDKSEGPSHYLNKQVFECFSHDTVIEFLGCIILSDSSHSRLHKAQRKDDISGWFKKSGRGEMNYLPYHWINEENYKNTLALLDEMCPYFEIDRAPSYQEFLAKNTNSKNLQVLLPGYVVPVPTPPAPNIFSLMFGSSHSTKTDPNSQIPTPCTLDLDQQQTPDSEDTLPICLSEIS